MKDGKELSRKRQFPPPMLSESVAKQILRKSVAAICAHVGFCSEFTFYGISSLVLRTKVESLYLAWTMAMNGRFHLPAHFCDKIEPHCSFGLCTSLSGGVQSIQVKETGFVVYITGFNQK
jgi:hypothetical protein